jgi:hypothetical protein
MPTAHVLSSVELSAEAAEGVRKALGEFMRNTPPLPADMTEDEQGEARKAVALTTLFEFGLRELVSAGGLHPRSVMSAICASAAHLVADAPPELRMQMMSRMVAMVSENVRHIDLVLGDRRA